MPNDGPNEQQVRILISSYCTKVRDQKNARAESARQKNAEKCLQLRLLPHVDSPHDSRSQSKLWFVSDAVRYPTKALELFILWIEGKIPANEHV